MAPASPIPGPKGRLWMKSCRVDAKDRLRRARSRATILAGGGWSFPTLGGAMEARRPVVSGQARIGVVYLGVVRPWPRLVRRTAATRPSPTPSDPSARTPPPLRPTLAGRAGAARSAVVLALEQILLRRDPVEEEDPVEVVELVLDHARLEGVRLDRDRLAFRCHRLDGDDGRAPHVRSAGRGSRGSPRGRARRPRRARSQGSRARAGRGSCRPSCGRCSRSPTSRNASPICGAASPTQRGWPRIVSSRSAAARATSSGSSAGDSSRQRCFRRGCG